MVQAAAFAGALLAAASGIMQLTSGDFSGGSPVPKALMATDCGGENRSPSLAWSAAPAATKSFALIMHDPDAPMRGGFYHWVVYNIPATARGLAANEKVSQGQLGVASTGKAAYYGPCPPPGPAHHYAFSLYALDVAHLSNDSPLTGPQLEAKVAGHVLARAVLQATAATH